MSTPSLQQQRARGLRLLLRALRQSKKVTQTELAARLGKPQSFVAKYEAGQRTLDVPEWIAVVEALEANPVIFLRTLLTPLPQGKR